MSTIKKTSAIFQLIRFPNLVMIVVSQYISAVYLVFKGDYWGDTLLRKDLFIVVLATVLIAAGGNIINDYFDVKIDGINKPQKLIIDHTITRRKALLWHILLSVAGIGLGKLLGTRIFILYLSTGILLWLYSYRYKRKVIIGNLLIALLTATSVYLPALLRHEANHLLLFFAVVAFFISLIREIIKDIEDMNGDGQFDCKTLPLVFGLKKTKQVLVGIIMGFMAILITMSLFFNSLSLTILISFTILALLGLMIKLLPADTKKEFAILSRYCKWLMLAGVLSMMIL
jgi:4-hydroxybenzoate polyprenyltransferase